jgi:UDP-N-acetylglucosamine:LPS N-acetylglucosamine transferase
MSKQLKYIISGGGSGGHIFPAVAIANALKTQRSELLHSFRWSHRKNGNGESAPSRL